MPVDPAPKTDDLLERLPSQMQIAQVIFEHLTAKAERNAKTGPIDVTIDVGEAAKAVLAIFTTTVAPLWAEVETGCLSWGGFCVWGDRASRDEVQHLMHEAERVDHLVRRTKAAEAALSRARAEAFEEAARVAEWAHMVEPDGGSPTEAEQTVAEEAARRIRSLATKGDQARPDAQTPAEGGTRDG